MSSLKNIKLTVGLLLSICESGSFAVGDVCPAQAQQSILQNSSAPTSSYDQVDTSDWQTYLSPTAAYSIKYPPGWQVSTDPQTGKMDVGAANGSRMSILPFFIPGKSLSDAPALFTTVLKNVYPGVVWSSPVVPQANAFKSTASSSTNVSTAVAIFNTASNGLVGNLCVTQEPVGSSHSALAKFALMMGTFKFLPPQRSAAGASLNAPQVSYHRFVDPNENAFWCDVPDGWSVQGGMKRVTAVDARPWVRAASPDGKMVVILGDPDLCPGTIPTPLLSSLGYPPGTTYGDSLVAPYHSALKFIEWYNKLKTSKVFSNMQLVQARDQPEIDRMYNANSSMHSAASAKYSGLYKGVPGIAFLLAATRGQMQANSGMWWVTLLGGFVATIDAEQIALNVYLRMFKTVEYNPQWSSAATANAGAVSRAWAASSDAVSQSITSGYWARQAVNEQSAHNFSNYIRGTADMRDPQTGTVYQVQYGPEQHWIDQTGTIIGTDNTVTPDVGWRRLIDK